jgi:hypothetical protein
MGLEWQCVEYVNRYYYLVYGMNLGVGRNAWEFYQNNTPAGLTRFANGGTTAPQVGDILCFNETGSGLGHVAIIRSVDQANSVVHVIQQNVKNGDTSPNGYGTDVDWKFAYSVIGGTYKVDVTLAGVGGSRLGADFYCQGWLRQAAPANLAAPTLSTPANGATGTSTQPNLSWSAVTGASSYRVMIATNPNDLPSDPAASTGGNSVVFNDTPSTASDTVSPALQAGTTYYWEVHGRSATQFGNWSSVYSFTTATPPNHLVIVPNYDAVDAVDPTNAGTIEATINDAIQVYENAFADPVTVHIAFAEETNGLGNSFSQQVAVTYNAYRSALVNHATTADDSTALSSIPATPGNPVNGGTSLFIKSPLARALGLGGDIATDGTIFINTAICNLTRSDSNPGLFDLMSVALHEIDEILAFGSALDTLSNGDAAPATIKADDLYRFDPAGQRSFNTDPTTQAIYSIDGGAHTLARFNQLSPAAQKADFGDWYSSGGQTPQVQDAFSTAGAAPNLGVELRRLDVLGFTPRVQIVSSTPGVPNLSPSSDTGSFSNDDWTSLNNTAGRTLQFSVGNTVAGATVTLFADGVQVGSAVANGSSTTITTDGATKLLDGTRQFTAKQTEPGKAASDSSGAEAVVIDATPPVIVNPGDQTFEIVNTAGTTVNFQPATATDNLNVTPVVSYDHAIGSSFSRGATAVTATATDLAGNSSSVLFDVVLNDAPFISPGPGAAYAFAGQAGAETLTVSTGSLSFVADASATRTNLSVVVTGGGTQLTIATGQHFGALAISDGMVVVANAGSVTINAPSFSISGNGKLDLGKSKLLTSASPSTIRSYLGSAYSGNGDWAGTGITSGLAAGNPVKYTVGYAVGSDQSAQDAGVAVSPGQVLVQPTLVGDTNLDGTVNFFDVSQLLGYKYNTGQAASYTDGDLDYSGKVDFFDIVTLLSANYNSGQVFATAPAAAPGALATGSETPVAPAQAPATGVAAASVPARAISAPWWASRRRKRVWEA